MGTQHEPMASGNIFDNDFIEDASDEPISSIRRVPEQVPEPVPAGNEFHAPNNPGPELRTHELGEGDAESSNRERTNRPNAFEKMCERLINRMDQPRVPAPVLPTFMDMVMAMKNLGTEKFNGGTDPFKADAWLRRLESNFHAIRCPDEFKRDVAVYYLEQDAANWWEIWERRLGFTFTSEWGWVQFRTEFLKKYFPIEARDRLEMQYMQLTQGERSVRDYEAEFTKLRRYARYGTHDEMGTARKFLQGLRPDLICRLSTVPYSDLSDLVEKAVTVEETLVGERKYYENLIRNQYRPKTSEQSRKGRQDRSVGRENRPAPTCFNCGRQGHIAANCKAQVVGRREITCWSCGELGHFSNQCPKGQNLRRPQPPAIQAGPKRLAIGPIPTQQQQPQAGQGRVYALDTNEAGPSRPSQPIAGTLGY